MPSGHIPIDAFQNPEKYDPNAMNCLIPVPAEVFATVEKHLEDEVGPRAQYFDWYSKNFGAEAEKVYRTLKDPPALTLQSAWDTFELMDAVLRRQIIY